MYTSTLKPDPNINRDHPMYDYFVGRLPGTWMNTPSAIDAFRDVFGETALEILKQFGIQPEHRYEKSAVGGTLINGIPNIRHVFGQSEAREIGKLGHLPTPDVQTPDPYETELGESKLLVIIGMLEKIMDHFGVSRD